MSVSSTNRMPSFEIRNTSLSLVALVLRADDLDTVQADLLRQFGPDGENPEFFDHDALVIDFSGVDTTASAPDLATLLQTLRTCRLTPVAVRGGRADWLPQLHALGLSEASAESGRERQATAASRPAEVVREVVQEVVKEVVREVPAPAALRVDKPLRSGQKVYARGGDLIVMAMVNQGAEVIADGNIHVYAPLRGKAMAGASGNTSARIFSLCLEPELVSIAGVYRTSENPFPADVRGKPAQVRLSDDGQEKLLIEALTV